jgi:flagellar hook-associated protein 3 FlgL
MHRQSLGSMQKQQALVQQTELQIASGLRIMKPSDDPVGAVKVLNLNSNLGTVEQYSRNIAQAQAALAYQESVLSSVNDSLQRIRELTVQANNPTNHAHARASIAQEMQEQLSALKVLANTRDTSGDYIFSGFRVDEPPFVDNAGVVSYMGDQGQRMVQIGEGARVAIRDAGDSIFMNIPGGDGEVQVLPGAANTGSVVVRQFGVTGVFVPDTYTLTFEQSAPGAPLQYTILDSATPVPNVLGSGTYADGVTLNVEGAQFTLAGTPAAGDTLTIRPAPLTDMFSMVGSITAALTATGTGAPAQAKIQNALTQGLANLDQALNTISNQRAAVGARLGNIDSIDSINQDFKLQLETVLSATQDLDYAEAITRFNLQLSSLQAAQQAYVKTADLSLFRYI